MRLLSYLAAFTLFAMALTACQSAQQNSAQSNINRATPAATTPGDGVRRITPTELKDLLATDQAVVIDVRNEGSYYAGHIPGAKLIPNTAILSHLQELPREKLIVTYCSWPAEHTSAGAVVNLKANRIENAAALLGGFEAWKSAGFPVETGANQ